MFVQISIFLPIGENFLMISGLVPMILIYSYSKDGFLPSSLIFWGDYDALLNALVCCCCCWTYLNVIVLIIDNERKTELAHSHKKFTSELGKDMLIRSYFMKHINNSLSRNFFQK